METALNDDSNLRNGAEKVTYHVTVCSAPASHTDRASRALRAAEALGPERRGPICGGPRGRDRCGLSAAPVG